MVDVEDADPGLVSVTADRGMLQVNRAVIVPVRCGSPSEPRLNWPPGWYTPLPLLHPG